MNLVRSEQGAKSIEVSMDAERRLLIVLKGVFGATIRSVTPPIPIETVNPDHGVHVLCNWNCGTVNFFMQGTQVDTQVIENWVA